MRHGPPHVFGPMMCMALYTHAARRDPSRGLASGFGATTREVDWWPAQSEVGEGHG